MDSNKRVEILDGLRVLAIFLVMIFHFYACFGKTISYSIVIPKIFHYGYLGVELFFIISGFVITLTLTKCTSFIEFLKKRFIRLIPGMIVCSSITFLVFNLYDSNNYFPQSKSFSNLLFSNTFINPFLFNKILGTHFSYIDDVYWSLFVELQFYFLAGLIYFYSPTKFLKNAIIVFLILFLIFLLTSNGIFFSGKLLWINIVVLGFFELPKYILWFLMGITINYIYFKKDNKKLLLFLLSLFFIQIYISPDFYIKSITVFFMLLFLCFLYCPKVLKLLTNSNVKKIGIASYLVYLMHQNIGVLVIEKCSLFFGAFNWIIPILLLFIFSFFGIVFFKYIEHPLSNKLKHLFKV